MLRSGLTRARRVARSTLEVAPRAAARHENDKSNVGKLNRNAEKARNVVGRSGPCGRRVRRQNREEPRDGVRESRDTPKYALERMHDHPTSQVFDPRVDAEISEGLTELERGMRVADTVAVRPDTTLPARGRYLLR